MRIPLIAGNWKMNGSQASIEELIGGLKAAGDPECEVAVFPPFVFLSQVSRLLGGTAIRMGAQNVDWHDGGAFTGEVSASMLVDVGCHYCIVGHSERRTLFGESDQVVAGKFAACMGQGLTPVVCVGESLEERQSGDTLAVVERQLMAVIDAVGIDGLGRGVIAYEPIWAIGTGESATPEQAEAVHAAVRRILAGADSSVSSEIRILYGGSVNRKNAA
ncbi:MAG TPA: triose-phosphate isomerase, partial [Pseudomonadales bacterium]|nr:triose-phosphate isomerase [Pseudomonadales bacterium]